MVSNSKKRQKCTKCTLSRSRGCNRKQKRTKHDQKTHKRCSWSDWLTNNPFFNFLQHYRKKHCGKSAVQIAVEGGKYWCKMPKEEKHKFYKQSCKITKKHPKRLEHNAQRNSRSCSRNIVKQNRSTRRIKQKNGSHHRNSVNRNNSTSKTRQKSRSNKRNKIKSNNSTPKTEKL